MTFPKLIVKYKEEERLFKEMQLVSLLQFIKEETGNRRSHKKAGLKVNEFNSLVENIKQLLYAAIIKKEARILSERCPG